MPMFNLPGQKQVTKTGAVTGLNQDGSVYSTRGSAAYAVYREDQWQRPSKHTELES